jgi:hypothetical protein
MTSLFLDAESDIHFALMNRGTTIKNAGRQLDICRHVGSSSTTFQPHTSHVGHKSHCQLYHWELLSDPPYISNLAAP